MIVFFHCQLILTKSVVLSVNGPHTWSWLSESVAWVKDSSTGTWLWRKGEPNNFETERCGETTKNGKYNNIRCYGNDYDDDPGYICEKQVGMFMIIPTRCYPIKNLSKKKKKTLIFMRVTPIHIFFLDWSTIVNNSENKDIFTERRTRPRSTSQPLVTKTTSTSSLRTQMANTRNKVRFTSTGIWHLIWPYFIAQFLTDISLLNSPPLPAPL